MGRAGFVLTGGASRRMGRDKALLPFRDATLVEWVAGVVRDAAGCVHLVGGSERYSHLGFPVLEEAFAGMGPLSGIEAALRLGGSEWNLVVACDLPGIRADGLRELLGDAERHGGRAIAATGSRGRGEPLCAVYHSSCLPVVQTMLAGGRLKATELLDLAGARLVLAPWMHGIRNVNTPEDWTEAGRTSG